MNNENHSHYGRGWTLLALVIGVLVLAAACSSSGEVTDDRISVVATTTILGDVVASIVGDNADVTVLLPVGADPHEYQPSSQEVSQMAKAALVVANGFGLEEGLAPALESVESDGGNVLYIAGSAVCEEGHEEGHEGEEHEDGNCDPHVWMDPILMQDATDDIAAALVEVDSGVDWALGADAYKQDLAVVIESMEDEYSRIPSENRLLVTNHDSLGYLADRFGFEVVGTVIPGGGTHAEPSSSHLAELVDTLDTLGIAVVFSETTEPDVLATAVATEASHEVAVVDLYVGSVGPPESDAATYIGMMLQNAEIMTTSLTP